MNANNFTLEELLDEAVRSGDPVSIRLAKAVDCLLAQNDRLQDLANEALACLEVGEVDVAEIDGRLDSLLRLDPEEMPV